MLYDFAMTPELFEPKFIEQNDPNGTVLVEFLRGLAENGLLADLNKGQWARQIECNSSNLSLNLRDKVLTCIKVLNDRNRLVRHRKSVTGNPSSNLDWLELIFDSHDQIPFDGIVLSEALMKGSSRKCNEFIEFCEVLDSKPWIDRKRTLTLQKSKSDYQTALEPILRYARKLRLIDPFLNSEEVRYLDTISICSNLLGMRRHNRFDECIVEIHSAKKSPRQENFRTDQIFSNWELKLQELMQTYRHKYRVYLWENQFDTGKFHDRYILTDQIGISVPWGVDCYERTHDSTKWNVLDEVDRELCWADFDQTSEKFELVGCEMFN